MFHGLEDRRRKAGGLKNQVERTFLGRAVGNFLGGDVAHSEFHGFQVGSHVGDAGRANRQMLFKERSVQGRYDATEPRSQWVQ